ncbi:nitrogenase iron-molybdenum cofactor biosynthesis protein NifE [Sporomusa sp.]|uniref:nitrogenase iron-molybdenum cofactor biosynthesis protein NifE n=1 Tax=Sporomusa sp. TaxID=2078658 RepID=UPI002C6AE3AA|nr:nitrogenase iron-molybdenum cofactor biosynthesis protein NifE [Sporomusa sp.]HWR09277.1 nitrogenase iron-molybdenum cofactor biosynthesis protein NifE [Sporomusa sp.]
MSETTVAISGREQFISTKGRRKNSLKCDSDSIAGCVSQRACVYCGARVVLNPVTDAIHLVHGPVGCASYTWDIRGSLSSGSELYRNSFTTDLREQDIIFGGEKKLAKTIDELVAKHPAKLMFVYSTCIVGVIGDDLAAICKAAAKRNNIEIIPVESSGFIGNKSAGYRAACEALLQLIDPVDRNQAAASDSINYLGDFNLAGEAWIIKDYLAQMGIKVNTVFTGDSTSSTLKGAANVSLNIVQCAGSMNYLAAQLQELYGIPYMQVSFLGIEDTAQSLRNIADAMGGGEIRAKAEVLIRRETDRVLPLISKYHEKFQGKKAAVYVGGGFKAISLIKQFREIGIEVVMIGTQTGRREEYDTIHELVSDGTVILDDANPAELERFMRSQGAHLLVGGVKERPLAYKLGLAFIDHNHDRKHPLSGYDGAVNFAQEVYSTLCSPVWKYTAAKGGS